jgi:hypothetical protein
MVKQSAGGCNSNKPAVLVQWTLPALELCEGGVGASE